MTCDDVRNLLDAYLDGELDLVTSLEFERHLPDCVGCTERLENRRVLRAALQSDALAFKAPSPLQQKIRAALPPASHPTLSSRLHQNVWISMAAALLLGVVVTAGLFQIVGSASAPANSLAQEVVASHIRSLMVDHLADVASTDQHTVKPWFDGKLDFSPTVVDLADQGFPLIGGRLDYLDNRPVTALVYQRNKHVINLFLWPIENPAEASAAPITIQGYHTINWISSGATYWAVSDLETGELQTFVQLIQAHIAPS